jgi:hypothetical protein
MRSHTLYMYIFLIKEGKGKENKGVSFTLNLKGGKRRGTSKNARENKGEQAEMLPNTLYEAVLVIFSPERSQIQLKCPLTA